MKAAKKVHNKLSKEEVLERIFQKTRQKHPELELGPLEVEDYVDTHSISSFVYEGKLWKTSALNLMRNGLSWKMLGLTKKAPNKTSAEDFIKKLEEQSRVHIQVDKEKFLGMKKKSGFIDGDYGYFEAIPADVLRGSEHPKRAKSKAMESWKMSAEEVNARIKAGYKSKAGEEIVPRDYLVVDEKTFVDTRTDCVFIDSLYGTFTAKPNHVFFGQEHPKRIKGKSRYEEEIEIWLNSIGVECLRNYKLINSEGKRKEIDIFVPSKNFGIELHGLYWHNENNRDRRDHMERRLFYEAEGVFVVQIYEDEWNFKKEVVKSLVLNRLQKNQHKVMARKTTIKKVSKKEADIFLNENHLMGASSASLLGLYFEDKLVSLMTYKVFKKKKVEIIRFCNAKGYSVAGGFSKLLKAVEKLTKARSVISWVDLRYGTGESLLKTGFRLEKVVLSFKWTDNIRTYNRLHCRANLRGSGLSEKEQAKLMKLYKIYDAGQGLYVKEIPKKTKT